MYDGRNEKPDHSADDSDDQSIAASSPPFKSGSPPGSLPPVPESQAVMEENASAPRSVVHIPLSKSRLSKTLLS